MNFSNISIFYVDIFLNLKISINKIISCKKWKKKDKKNALIDLFCKWNHKQCW